MPNRVVAAATALSTCVLTLAALLLMYFYWAHEIGEFDGLLRQDRQIAAQRFIVDDTGAVTHFRTGTETLYDRPDSEWMWQLFRYQAGVRELVDQSDSLGPLGDASQAIKFPEGRFASFEMENGLKLRGQIKDVALLGGEDRYALGIAAPMLHVAEEVREAVLLVAGVFIGLAFVLSALVYTVVKTGLRPLTRLKREVEQIQSGGGTISDRAWPSDLLPIVEELRALDDRIGTLIGRHRRQAGDLAHALKTPLAIIKRITPDLDQGDRQKIEEQTGRITTAVRRNLSRLRAGAFNSQTTPIHEAVEEIVFALDILFREKSLDIRNKIPNDLVFRGDPDDLKEIVGNLLDNACKWAQSRIDVSCTTDGAFHVLTIGDDGPGLMQGEQSTDATDTDLDTQFVSGVGLAIVEDIAELYGGKLEKGRSPQGGAEFRVWLPAGQSV